MNWGWGEIAPFEQALIDQTIDDNNVNEWLRQWSTLAEYLSETFNRLHVATTVNTNDKDAETQLNQFLDEIYPNAKAAGQILKEKLLASGLKPNGFSQPLKNMQTDAQIFREKNIQLKSDELKLITEYDRIAGAQSILWDGNEVTLERLKTVYQEHNRSRREDAWRLSAQRQLEDRGKFNDLWLKFLDIRLKIADHAGFNNYRDYRWLEFHRFDYTPEDAKLFDNAIKEVVVPIAEKIYQKRMSRLGVDTLRPWDLYVDPLGRSPLKPFEDIESFKVHTSQIFHQVDPQLGAYFDIMRQENLLDLDNRKGKAPGGYCTDYSAARRPFIFMNAVGIHDDVQTLLHEGGHAFHVFESSALPYIQQTEVPMEFAEVASMAMELLSAPYLSKEYGGFYSREDASRARIEHLETSLLFWPYMAVVDRYQHWVYENPKNAKDPTNCDQTWSELWDIYMVGIDWTGLEEEKITGWHRKLHIFQVPFYYIEYGLAQLGAVQVWSNAIQDQGQAVRDYREALSLGCTLPLPELFSTAGAKFSFDAETLQKACDLMLETIEDLEETIM